MQNNVKKIHSFGNALVHSSRSGYPSNAYALTSNILSARARVLHQDQNRRQEKDERVMAQVWCDAECGNCKPRKPASVEAPSFTRQAGHRKRNIIRVVERPKKKEQPGRIPQWMWVKVWLHQKRSP